MKKVLFAIISFFGILTLVNALENEYLIYDWSINQGKTSNYLYYDETIEDDDGYVTISIDENMMGVLRKITKDGKTIIWEKENTIGLHLSLRQDENYYYTVTFGYYNYYNYGEVHLCRYSHDGDLDECIMLEDGSNYLASGAEIYINEDNLKIMVAGQEYTTNNYGPLKIYTVESTESSFTLEETENYSDITETELVEITGQRNMMFDGVWEDIIPEEHEDVVISNQYSDEKYTYAVGDIVQDGIAYGFIIKIDQEENVQWFKKSEEALHYFDVTSTNQRYVAVVAYKDETEIGIPRDENNVESYILVYNEDGEIVETHDVATEIETERADVTHFLPFGNCIIAHAFAYDENGDFSSYVIRYTVNYKIDTVINGKGSIEVVEKSKSGDSVTFKVTPEEGYVLSEVKVTDANGNTITFTENTFTMPSADVTIEVTFAKEETNPETSDLIIISCIAIIVSGIVLTYLNIKKRISMI